MRRITEWKCVGWKYVGRVLFTLCVISIGLNGNAICEEGKGGESPSFRDEESTRFFQRAEDRSDRNARDVRAKHDQRHQAAAARSDAEVKDAFRDFKHGMLGGVSDAMKKGVTQGADSKEDSDGGTSKSGSK